MFAWDIRKCFAVGGMLLVALLIITVGLCYGFHESRLGSDRDDITTEHRIDACRTLTSEAAIALCIETVK